MDTKIDHTAAIFTALGVTPETQPWAYNAECYKCGREMDSSDYLCSWCSSEGDDILLSGQWHAKSLLSGTIEADGLAVRLVEIARRKRILAHPKLCELRNVWIVAPYSTLDTWKTQYNISFAAAVHDALVEALGIVCEHCGCGSETCNTELWAQQKKCCPDCTHGKETQ